MAVNTTVIEEFADKLNLTKRDLLMRSRGKTVSKARLILYKFIRDNTNLTYADIGFMVNRRYSTVILGVKSANNLLYNDDEEAIYMWDAIKDIDIARENKEVVSLHKYGSSWIIKVSNTVRGGIRDIVVSKSVFNQLKDLLNKPDKGLSSEIDKEILKKELISQASAFYFRMLLSNTENYKELYDFCAESVIKLIDNDR